MIATFECVIKKSRIVIRTNFVGHKKEKESKKKWLNKNISLFLSSQRDSAAKSTKPIAQETKVSSPNPNQGTSPSPSPVQTGEKPKPSSVVAQESLDSHRSSGDRKFDLLGAQNPVHRSGGGDGVTGNIQSQRSNVQYINLWY